MSIADLQSRVLEASNVAMREAQAAMKQARTEIHFLRASDEIKTRALKAARVKLKLYRAEHSGAYAGGMEYTALMALIEEAIGP